MRTKIQSVENIADDHALVAKIQKGDEKAFAVLFNKYKQTVFFYLMKHTRKNEELSKDILSETFRKVYEKINTFSSERGAITTWMFTIAKREYIDHLRRNKMEVISTNTPVATDEHGDNMVIESILEAKDLSPLELVIKDQRAKAVHEAIRFGIHDETMRKLVTMRYMGELSYEEIAEETALPMGTVKANLHRAKSMMKNYMSTQKLFA